MPQVYPYKDCNHCADHVSCSRYDVEDNEARPYDTELDEYHPKATRTLFIGNLEKDISAQDIRQAFDQFGEIIVSFETG